jgi:3-phenylpropionate/trans-cinnamate dioxygenase ferredoxin component
MAEWMNVARDRDLVTTLGVTAGDSQVALFRTEDGIFALDDICSHEYSRLSLGDVWGGEVYCEKHGSRFNLRTGAVTGLPATAPVRAWNVKVENGEIWIARRTEDPS